jgi:hypothetical protein
MKRKILLFTIVLSLLVSNGIFLYANSTEMVEKGDQIFNNAKEIMSKQKSNSNLLETENQLIDFRPIESKSSSKKPLENSNQKMKILKSNPINTSSIDCRYNIFFGSKAIAESSSTTEEDYIYAKSRSYNSDDSLIDSKTDSENNSSFVSATSINDTFTVLGDYAYGNHVYKKSGYKDVIHETYDEWKN